MFNKHQSIPSRVGTKILVSSTITLVVMFAVFLAVVLVFNTFLTIVGATTGSASAATYTSSISTSGTVNLDVSSTGNGANVVKDEVKIISTCPSGYNISIAGPNDTTLYKDGNKSNTANTKKINKSSGTIDSPASIINNKNTWGYMTEELNGNNPVTINSNFIGLTNTQTNIRNKSTGTTATGETLSVYYGASVDASIEPGLYKMAESTTGANDNVITYYLTSSIDCISYMVNFNPTSTANGETVSGTGTMSSQRIYENVTTALTNNAFTDPTGYTFIGWNTKQDGTGTSYTNGQQVTDIANVGQTITLYAQWRTDYCPGNNICYNPNGATADGTTANPTMSNQSISATDTEATLWASNFKNPTKGTNNKKAGFAGWNTKADGTGTNYGPNETITFTAGQYASSGLKLYANWIESTGNLQSWSGCSTLSIGDVTALTDTRDNETYAVAKLADGNCWMIENLRLADKKPDNTPITLSSTNTNKPISSFTQLSASQNPTTTAWCTDSKAACQDQSMLYTGNTTDPVTNMSSSNANIYSYGNYYNWYSVTAGNGTYSFNTHNNSVAGDICPAGWRLPKGGNKTRIESNDDNDFWNLVVDGLNNGTLPANYSSKTNPFYTGWPEGSDVSKLTRSYPNNFIYSGVVGGSSVSRRGTYGQVWSSTVGNSNGAYILQILLASVYPGTDGWAKWEGFPARCMVGV